MAGQFGIAVKISVLQKYQDYATEIYVSKTGTFVC